MSDEISYRAFFGDRERTFTLSDQMLSELERVTGTGIGALWMGLIGQTYSLATLHEIIRLGLIGGGASPEEAARLVATYAHNRPLAEVFPLAFETVNARWVGNKASAHEVAA